MRLKTITRYMTAGLFVTTATGAVLAQDMMQILPNDYFLSDILNQQRIEAAIGADNTPAPVEAASTAYTASPQVSARVKTQFVDNLRQSVGNAGADQIADTLEGTDPVAAWEAIVGGDGLRKGDVADAFASYWILNWVMANGADSTGPQAQAVREQVRPIIAGQTDLGDAGRQEMAEVMMLNFLIQHAAYVNALTSGDTQMQKQLGDAAHQRFTKEMGVDLRALSLTDEGFVGQGS